MIEISLLIAYSLFLLYRGFIHKKPGWFTWHMFAKISLSYFELKDPHGNTLNPWDYFPHTQLHIHPYDLEVFLKFLREKKGIKATGKVVIMTEKGYYDLKIIDSHVVH